MCSEEKSRRARIFLDKHTRKNTDTKATEERNVLSERSQTKDKPRKVEEDKGAYDTANASGLPHLADREIFQISLLSGTIKRLCTAGATNTKHLDELE